MGVDENVVLTPGYVPDSLRAVAGERFAFALPGLDLLTPARVSLEFFCPRLELGGYLVMHDYNNSESDGRASARWTNSSPDGHSV